jgi:hypothetical protein
MKRTRPKKDCRLMTEPLILKRAPIGDNQEDYDVLENGVVVGRIFLSPAAPQDRPWMWASGHTADSVSRAAHGYEPTREAAMAAFKKSWRRGLTRNQRGSCPGGNVRSGTTTTGGGKAGASSLPWFGSGVRQNGTRSP